MMCEVVSLGSGSSGNMTYIRVGDVRLLIDAGISNRAAERAMAEIGVDPNTIDAIFVTHEHTDHVKGLPVFTKKHPTKVHAAGITADFVECADGCLVKHPPLYSEVVGCVTVSSFVTPHDSRCSVGYIISSNDDDTKVGFATDLGHVSGETEELLAECEYVVLESNHDPNLLRYGPYPHYLKQRIASNTGHLSNADCASCVTRLAGRGVKGIMLAHLSEENNRPELALIESSTALERSGKSDLVLRVAARCVPVRLC